MHIRLSRFSVVRAIVCSVHRHAARSLGFIIEALRNCQNGQAYRSSVRDQEKVFLEMLLTGRHAEGGIGRRNVSSPHGSTLASKTLILREI